MPAVGDALPTIRAASAPTSCSATATARPASRRSRALVAETLRGAGLQRRDQRSVQRRGDRAQARPAGASGRHSLQIELKRRSTWTRTTLEPNAGYAKLAARSRATDRRALARYVRERTRDWSDHLTGPARRCQTSAAHRADGLRLPVTARRSERGTHGGIHDEVFARVARRARRTRCSPPPRSPPIPSGRSRSSSRGRRAAAPTPPRASSARCSRRSSASRSTSSTAPAAAASSATARSRRRAPDGYTIGIITVEIGMMHWQGLTDLTGASYTPLALVNADPAGVQVARRFAVQDASTSCVAAIKANPGQVQGVGHGAGRHLASRDRRHAAGPEGRSGERAVGAVATAPRRDCRTSSPAACRSRRCRCPKRAR